MYLSIIVTSVGLIFQVIFHLGTNENALRTDAEIHNENIVKEARLDWTGYLKSPKFYIVSFCYYFCLKLF
jgi:hypothetical protein